KNSPAHNALKLLDCIIIKCLQKEPSKRFRNVRELMDALSLVNDCICNGSTKKLPPKAEKLLIFRFLDLFGNKIAAGMTAYLIFGFVCMRVIGEVNLQKHVDQAALSANFDDQRSKDNWISAIKQAEWLHKPPSFMAALHNNLGDAYAGLISGETFIATSQEPWLHVSKSSAHNENARKAINEYQKAYEYYSKGHFYKSNALDLLRGMTAMWSSLESKGVTEDRHAEAVSEVQKLWLAKKYSECAQVAEKYLQYVPDKHLAFYAANANTEIALTLPAAKAMKYFERAAYYFSQSDAKLNFECDNLSICISRLGLNPDSPDTRNALGRAAIERGDLQAAYAEYSRMQGFDADLMADRIKELLSWKIQSSQTYEADPVMKEAIKPLERMLALEEEAGDKNSRALWSTLSNLATNYRLSGEDKKAVEAYKRLVEMMPHSSTDQLAYVDQLVKVGRKADARRYLEKEVGKIASTEINPLPIRLLKAYADDNMQQQVRDTLIKLVPYREPQRSVSMGYYQYPALPLANRPYSRNGVIYRK
ncbi:MAG: hypothetical protein IT342_26940, partial [Candidatus Melainabacteria bacterium]|nr:hypothetical protein [Candidatus Melainabacteria bacterium]